MNWCKLGLHFMQPVKYYKNCKFMDDSYIEIKDTLYSVCLNCKRSVKYYQFTSGKYVLTSKQDTILRKKLKWIDGIPFLEDYDKKPDFVPPPGSSLT